MTCASHLVGTACREDDGERHSSFTNMRELTHVGKEERETDMKPVRVSAAAKCSAPALTLGRLDFNTLSPKSA